MHCLVDQETRLVSSIIITFAEMTFQQHVTFTTTFSEICFHLKVKDLV